MGDRKFSDYFAAFEAFLMPLLHFDFYPIVDERFRGSFPWAAVALWDGDLA
jgi:hypothetical protein